MQRSTCSVRSRRGEGVYHPPVPSSAWRTVPLVVVGLMLACKQAEPPAAAAPSEPVAAEPAAAEPAAELVMADGRVQVDITYCIP